MPTSDYTSMPYPGYSHVLSSLHTVSSSRVLILLSQEQNIKMMLLGCRILGQDRIRSVRRQIRSSAGSAEALRNRAIRAKEDVLCTRSIPTFFQNGILLKNAVPLVQI